jgi:hypothetical protein
MKKNNVPAPPAPAKTLDFYDALKELANGNKITRAEWPSENYAFFTPNGFLSLHYKHADHHWIIAETDMQATDWQVI